MECKLVIPLVLLSNGESKTSLTDQNGPPVDATKYRSMIVGPTVLNMLTMRDVKHLQEYNPVDALFLGAKSLVSWILKENKTVLRFLPRKAEYVVSISVAVPKSFGCGHS
ncbi:hypothetical protein Tco_0291471 [Tanacetum coccineum]